MLESGKEIVRRKAKGQTSFGDAWISQDGRTVGWLVMYPLPDATYPNDIAGALVIYRAGHVVRTFRPGGLIWNWQFQDSGKRVAWSTGYMHGGVQAGVLADVDSGRTAAQWSRQSGDEFPDWANLCIE